MRKNYQQTKQELIQQIENQKREIQIHENEMIQQMKKYNSTISKSLRWS